VLYYYLTRIEFYLNEHEKRYTKVSRMANIRTYSISGSGCSINNLVFNQGNTQTFAGGLSVYESRSAGDVGFCVVPYLNNCLGSGPA
jgi:hypothetical protein